MGQAHYSNTICRPIEAYAAQLKLTLLNGLNPRLSNTADFIANTRPLLSFTSAVNMLRLKELRLANDNKVASNSALAASTTVACTSPSCRSTPSSSQPRGGGKGKEKGGKGGGNGGGNSGGGGGRGGGRNQQQHGGQGSQNGTQPGAPPNSPWVCFNPWAWGPQKQWCPPMAPLPRAHTAFTPSQVSPPALAPAGYLAPGG